eukprot:g3940.t1
MKSSLKRAGANWWEDLPKLKETFLPLREKLRQAKAMAQVMPPSRCGPPCKNGCTCLFRPLPSIKVGPEPLRFRIRRLREVLLQQRCYSAPATRQGFHYKRKDTSRISEKSNIPERKKSNIPPRPKQSEAKDNSDPVQQALELLKGSGRFSDELIGSLAERLKRAETKPTQPKSIPVVQVAKLSSDLRSNPPIAVEKVKKNVCLEKDVESDDVLGERDNGSEEGTIALHRYLAETRCPGVLDPKNPTAEAAIKAAISVENGDSLLEHDILLPKLSENDGVLGSLKEAGSTLPLPIRKTSSVNPKTLIANERKKKARKLRKKRKREKEKSNNSYDMRTAKKKREKAALFQERSRRNLRKKSRRNEKK